MSYANLDGVPSQSEGVSEVLASDWNTYVRDNFDSIKFGHVVCTSSTRPTGVAEGTMIYETDTKKALVYNGSSWVEVMDLDRAGALPETSPGHLIVADDTAKTALTPSEGMMVYQSDNNKVFVYSGSAWVEVSNLDNFGGLSTTALASAYSGKVLASGHINSAANGVENAQVQVSLGGQTTFTVPYTGCAVRMHAWGYTNYTNGSGSPSNLFIRYQFKKASGDAWGDPAEGYTNKSLAGSESGNWTWHSSWVSGALTAGTTYTVYIAVNTGNVPVVWNTRGGSFTVEIA